MNILEEIIEHKKDEVNKLKRSFHLRSFEEMDFYEKPALKLKDFISPDAFRNNC